MNVDEEVISEIEKRRKLADHYYDNFRKYYENKNFMNDSMFEDNRKRTEKLLEKLVKILDAELKARLKG